MRITKENVTEIKVGQEVWTVEGAFRMPDKYTCMGKHPGYPEVTVFSDKSGHGLSIHELYHNEYVNKIFTSYDEACEWMRVQSINIIDHYNSHQLKYHPIPISEEDQKHLWKNREED